MTRRKFSQASLSLSLLNARHDAGPFFCSRSVGAFLEDRNNVRFSSPHLNPGQAANLIPGSSSMFVGARARFVLLSFAFAAFFGAGAFAQDAAAVPNAPTSENASTPKNENRLGGAKNNFREFGHQFFSPWTFILPAGTAAISQARSDDHVFESGAEGYGHRYGVYLADNVDAKFIRAFAMPTIFNQVERYQALGSGQRFGRRFEHAFVHTFVTRNRDGNRTINMSGIPASFAVGAVGMAYYPGKYGDGWHMVQRAAWMQAGYFGQDLWREFRPQICRAIHIKCGGQIITP
jgi:hypothetical protein